MQGPAQAAVSAEGEGDTLNGRATDLDHTSAVHQPVVEGNDSGSNADITARLHELAAGQANARAQERVADGDGVQRHFSTESTVSKPSISGQICRYRYLSWPACETKLTFS